MSERQRGCTGVTQNDCNAFESTGRCFAGSNPGHHFLASYRRALMGICEAQFSSKALKVCFSASSPLRLAFARAFKVEAPQNRSASAFHAQCTTRRASGALASVQDREGLGHAHAWKWKLQGVWGLERER